MGNLLGLLLSNKLLVAVTLIALVILSSFLLLSKPRKIPSPVLSPSPSVSINYQEAFPQGYRNEGNNKFGSLIVDSTPQGARVMIDAKEEEIPTKQTSLPINTTPFKVSQIPVGKHVLEVFKQGYNLTTMIVIIESNKISQVNIELTKPDTKVDY